jgi:DNA-binding MurR/RpiR family transcriptional regulator
LRAVLSARQKRVRTIGITNDPASELAKSVDILLTTDVVERPEGSFSIGPRMCQLVVCDRLVEAMVSRQSEPAHRDRRRRVGQRTVR